MTTNERSARDVLEQYRATQSTREQRAAERRQRRTIEMLAILGIQGFRISRNYRREPEWVSMGFTSNVDVQYWPSGPAAWVVKPSDFDGDYAAVIEYMSPPPPMWLLRLGYGRRALGEALVRAVDRIGQYDWGENPERRRPFPMPERRGE